VAAPSGQLKASRYFLAIAAILGILFALVFFTGDGKPQPRLGLDLKGGASMTLSATLPGGKAPDKAKLEQARQIIADRVDTSGVSEPDVVTEGDHTIVVNVAGQTNEDELRKLVAPAELRFRKVLGTAPDSSTDEPDASASASPSGSASAGASASASASASAAPSATAGAASGSAAPSDGANPSASAAPVDPTTEQKRQAVIAKLGGAYQLAEQIAQQVEDPSQIDPQYLGLLAPFGKLSADEVAVLPALIQFKTPTITCKQLDARLPGALSEPKQQVVACGKDSTGRVKYLLDEAKVIGEDVNTATADNDIQQGGWLVNLSFKSGGQDKWTALTKEAYDNGAKKQVAIVLDNTVVSAPAIQGIIDGDAVISGSFTKDDVQTLARQLKFGALPLGFKVESVDTVPPTLGLQYMKMGLLAGAIGLGLVVIYCLFYYRLLGLVVVASLVVSGALVFGCLVVLGRQIGFTLTLSGIAGFIVAIGITADSFVVFFERLKDEVKEGRSVRSAVPRAWVRARRTILSADAVSILAAVVLYVLAIGPVKGFAFTLGLSTLIDVLIVFLFTHPLVAVLSRWNAVTSPRVSGLGNMRPDRLSVADKAPARIGAARTRES
jgi:preprotein translocase subunit SecD